MLDKGGDGRFISCHFFSSHSLTFGTISINTQHWECGTPIDYFMLNMFVLASLCLGATKDQFSHPVVTVSRRHAASSIPTVNLCWSFTLPLLQTQLWYSCADSHHPPPQCKCCLLRGAEKTECRSQGPDGAKQTVEASLVWQITWGPTWLACLLLMGILKKWSDSRHMVVFSKKVKSSTWKLSDLGTLPGTWTQT